MVVEKSPFSANALEQFVLLAKSTKGAACTELIKQVLEAPGVYVFGELLHMQNIEEVKIVQLHVLQVVMLFFSWVVHRKKIITILWIYSLTERTKNI